MKTRLLGIGLMTGLLAFVFACGGAKPQQKKPSARQTAAIRDRSGDAFAELGAVERGEPPPLGDNQRAQPGGDDSSYD